MDFFKVKGFGRYRKSKKHDSDLDKNQLTNEQLNAENGQAPSKAEDPDPAKDAEDEDDDDFITNEVKRRLKELRKNSFMVLIPEESCPDDEEGEEETSSSECREQEVGDGHVWYNFDALYSKYSERMTFFDRMITQHLQNAVAEPCNMINQSPRYASRKLSLTRRNLYFKRKEELQEDGEYLRQQQDEVEDSYQNLETGYVAHICLAWEALHCQYIQLMQKILLHPGNSICYCFPAQAFQQFQVLLQRFVENEPFEPGSRIDIYARSRNKMPKLLQVPSFQGLELKNQEHDDLDSPVLAMDLVKVIQEAILTFRLFLKMEKKKSSSNANEFGGHQFASSLQQVQVSLNKKEIKLKELFRKKAVKRKSWPATQEGVELLFGLIDIKIVSRVLRMARISKEQLLWCEEKMSKLSLSERKLEREGAPILFPC